MHSKFRIWHCHLSNKAIHSINNKKIQGIKHTFGSTICTETGDQTHTLLLKTQSYQAKRALVSRHTVWLHGNTMARREDGDLAFYFLVSGRSPAPPAPQQHTTRCDSGRGIDHLQAGTEITTCLVLLGSDATGLSGMDTTCREINRALLLPLLAER